MPGQGYKGSRGGQSNGAGEKIFRTEWRVLSKNRATRTEVFDVSFSRSQAVHEHMSRKLSFVLTQLQNNVLRFGEVAEFSKAYFISKN